MRWLAMIPILMSGAVSGQEIGSSRFAELMRCRAIVDAAQRLSCYDAGAAALQSAVDHKDVSVVDRSEVERAQRSLFGIAVPRIQLFNKLGSPEAKQLDTVVTHTSFNAEGQLTFTVTDGAVWQQTDDYPMPGVKPGRKVTIKTAALGSFFATFDKGASVRVKRLR